MNEFGKVCKDGLDVPPPFLGPSEVQANDQPTIEEFYRFRSGVLADDGLYVSTLPDEHAVHARHWIVSLDGRIVATARLCLHGTISDVPDCECFSHLGLSVFGPIACMSRLAVSPTARRKGLASLLDRVRIAAAQSEGARCVLGEFPEYRVKGLLAMGFRSLGEYIGDVPFVNWRMQVLYLELSK